MTWLLFVLTDMMLYGRQTIENAVQVQHKRGTCSTPKNRKAQKGKTIGRTQQSPVTCKKECVKFFFHRLDMPHSLTVREQTVELLP